MQVAGGKAGRGEARRIVVKVGSSSLTTAAGGLDADRVDALVDVLAKVRSGGEQGDRAGLLRRHRRRPRPAGPAPPPRDLARQQAAASVGQGLLVARYTASFARYGVRVGQVLLTTDDTSRRAHYRNAYRTLDQLLAMGAAADRQRERHRRHRRDPLRRQRPARRPRRPPRPRRPAGPALRRRRPLRRRPAHARHLADRRGARPRRPRAASRSAARARPASAPAAWSPRSRRPGSRPPPASPSSSPPPSTPPTPSPAAPPARYFHRTGKRSADRLLWLAHASTPQGALTLDDGAVRAVVERRTLAAAGRDRRRRGRVRRRRPGRAARRRRAARSPAGSSTSTPRRSPGCSAAPPGSWPGSWARRTSGRSCTGTIWSSCTPETLPGWSDAPVSPAGRTFRENRPATPPRPGQLCCRARCAERASGTADGRRRRSGATHRRPPVRRGRPGAAAPRGGGAHAGQRRAGEERPLTSVGGRRTGTARARPRTRRRDVPPAVARHPQRLRRRGPAEGGPARPGAARPRPPLPADQPLRQRPRGDPLLGGGPRPARRRGRRPAAVGRAPLDRRAAAVGDRRPGGHRPRRPTTSASRRATGRRPAVPGRRPPLLSRLARRAVRRPVTVTPSRGVERAADCPAGALRCRHDHALAVRLHVPGHPRPPTAPGPPPPTSRRCRGPPRTTRCWPSRTRWRSVPSEIVAANAEDIAQAREAGTSEAIIDRLTLTPERVARHRRRRAATSPRCPTRSARCVRGSTLPNGIDLRQVRVPLGVVGIIYEARPNVTVDAAALCLKSGNAVLLRGSSSAYASNTALVRRAARRRRRRRAARRRGPARARREPRLRTRADARPRPGRRADPARRRLPDPHRRRGVHRPGHRDRHRQLPRLRRRRTPTSTWPSTS